MSELTATPVSPPRDIKMIVICVLCGAVCGLASWILSDALRGPSVAQGAQATGAPAATTTPVLATGAVVPVQEAAEPAQPDIVQVFVTIEAAEPGSVDGTTAADTAAATVTTNTVPGTQNAAGATSTTPQAQQRRSSPQAVTSRQGQAARPDRQARSSQRPLTFLSQRDGKLGGTPVTVNNFSTTVNSSTASWMRVVASGGSVVFIGPDGQLTANTGDSTASGIIALESGTSSLQTAPSADGSSPSSVQSPSSSARSAPSASVAQGTASALVVGGGAGLLLPNGAFDTVDIAGFEDHSLHIAGNDQIVTYDDSNLFINRDGAINANTGDTDSSGLIAVDVTNSTIRSGDSGGEDDDDDGSGGEEPEEEEEARSSGDAAETVPQGTGESSVGESAVGSVTDADADMDADDTDTDTGSGADEAPAPGTTSFTVGGDGFDDLSVVSEGNGNVITEDDSNVVIGGTGSVNAQIGDNDTGGVVAMGVNDSDLMAGCAADACAAD